MAPFTTVLTHRGSSENGCLFEVGDGSLRKLRWERAKGALLNPDLTLTPEAIFSRWEDINDFSEPEYPSGIADLQHLLEKAKQLMPSAGRGQMEFKGKVALITGAASG